MKYNSRNFKNKMHHIEDIYSILNKKYTIYSYGGKIERSLKQRLGKKINKDFDRKFEILKITNKILKKIDDKIKSK